MSFLKIEQLHLERRLEGGRSWEGNNSPMILSWFFILNKTCCNIVFVSNEVTNWSTSKLAGSKLLSYWPEMSAAIMFCWPLIASRVAFSPVKWKKFHFSDLSVSWCLWRTIVMGNGSAFISNHFSVWMKWIVNIEVIYVVRVCFVQECFAHLVDSPLHLLRGRKPRW